MPDNPYTVGALTFAVALLNDPPMTLDDLNERCSASGLVSDFVLQGDDLVASRRVLDAFASIVDTGDPRERADVLNRYLEGYLEHPRLTAHDGTWHLHFREPGAPLATVLATMVFGRAATFLAEHGMRRLGRCLLDGCGRAFVDLSRNGRQRYCSPACGNRNAVRRHRARADPRTSRPAAGGA